MKIRMILLIMLVSVVLIACDDTAYPEKDEDFILAVMVLDTGGQPKAGMTVARLNDLEGFDVYRAPGLLSPADSMAFPYPNPFFGSTTIKFSNRAVSNVLLEVSDWRGRHVRKLMEHRIDAGFYSVVWNQFDDGGLQVMNGVYTIRLTLTDTLDVPEYEWSGLVECTVFDLRDTYRYQIDTTDMTGFFSTRDLDLFPSLQGHGVQDAYNEVAELLGTFSFSDTVSIRVSTPPPAEGGWVYHMSRDIVLVDGPNYLEFTFVPDDSSGVFVPSH